MKGVRYLHSFDQTRNPKNMTDSNTLQALILAAGMATAGGLIFEDPVPVDVNSGVQVPKIILDLLAVRLDAPRSFGEGIQ